MTPEKATRRKTISVRLTERQAEGLMEVGNRGVADLHDSGTDFDLESADAADEALGKLGRAMSEAWPETTEGP